MGAEFPPKSTIQDERHYRIRLLGTGAADPTVQFGPVTVTHQATGVYRITFPKNPGTFIGLVGMPAFGAETPGDVKGQTCTRDTWTAPTASASGYLDVSVWSSAFAADDLQATEYLDLTIAFSESSEAA